jgi:hypothetical protein
MSDRSRSRYTSGRSTSSDSSTTTRASPAPSTSASARRFLPTSTHRAAFRDALRHHHTTAQLRRHTKRTVSTSNRRQLRSALAKRFPCACKCRCFTIKFRYNGQVLPVASKPKEAMQKVINRFCKYINVPPSHFRFTCAKRAVNPFRDSTDYARSTISSKQFN